MLIAEIIVYGVLLYLSIGTLFAAWFVIFGISKLDEFAAESSTLFRLFVFFGAAAFWIFLVYRLANIETFELNAK